MSLTAPVDVVQRQLDAYNRRDIEGYLATFADAATLFDLGATLPSATGKAQIRERYQPMFERSPQLHGCLVSRVTFEQVVVDVEYITGRNGAAEAFEVLAIYEVRDQLIQRAHFVRKA